MTMIPSEEDNRNFPGEVMRALGYSSWCLPKNSSNGDHRLLSDIFGWGLMQLAIGFARD